MTAQKSRDTLSPGNTQVDRDLDEDSSINEQSPVKKKPITKGNWSS